MVLQLTLLALATLMLAFCVKRAMPSFASPRVALFTWSAFAIFLSLLAVGLYLLPEIRFPIRLR